MYENFVKETNGSIEAQSKAILAVQVRLDAFTRVKKAIDDIIAQLPVEKQDEINHTGFCIEEFNTNTHETEKKEREKSDLVQLTLPWPSRRGPMRSWRPRRRSRR